MESPVTDSSVVWTARLAENAVPVDPVRLLPPPLLVRLLPLLPLKLLLARLPLLLLLVSLPVQLLALLQEL